MQVSVAHQHPFHHLCDIHRDVVTTTRWCHRRSSHACGMERTGKPVNIYGHVTRIDDNPDGYNSLTTYEDGGREHMAEAKVTRFLLLCVSTRPCSTVPSLQAPNPSVSLPQSMFTLAASSVFGAIVADSLVCSTAAWWTTVGVCAGLTAACSIRHSRNLFSVPRIASDVTPPRKFRVITGMSLGSRNVAS